MATNGATNGDVQDSSPTTASASVEIKKDDMAGLTSEQWAKERDDAAKNSTITNSDDPKLIKARIFVGNLPGDLRTEKGDIFDKFRKHGPILGCSIHQRFAFCQFEREEDAKAAVKGEHRSEFRSARLDVKMSAEGRKTDDSRNRNDGDRNRDRDRTNTARRRSRSPIDRRRAGSRDSRDRSYRDDSRYADRDRYRPHSRDRTPPPPYIPIPVEERLCHPRTYGANDVEMVVIRKETGEYADSILRRLYERRISANMLFLAEHASLEGAVSEFGRSGSHYVIIIMPKHADTRAITVNIFDGPHDTKPREYRNINVDEGVTLIDRHFRDHYPALARLRDMEFQGSGFYPQGPAEVMRTLARMVETCAVPTTSLDQTIRYLEDMRDRTAVAEGITLPTVPYPVVAATQVLAPAQPVVAASAYRAAIPGAVDPATLAAKHLAVDQSARPVAAAASTGGASEDAVREQLLTLLKATGLVGNLGNLVAAAQPQTQSQSPYSTQAAAASNDYSAYTSSGTASQYASSGNSALYVQQPGSATQYATSTSAPQYSTGNSSYATNSSYDKSYDSLVSSGMLRPGQVQTPTGTSRTSDGYSSATQHSSSGRASDGYRGAETVKEEYRSPAVKTEEYGAPRIKEDYSAGRVVKEEYPRREVKEENGYGTSSQDRTHYSTREHMTPQQAAQYQSAMLAQQQQQQRGSQGSVSAQHGGYSTGSSGGYPVQQQQSQGRGGQSSQQVPQQSSYSTSRR